MRTAPAAFVTQVFMQGAKLRYCCSMPNSTHPAWLALTVARKAPFVWLPAHACMSHTHTSAHSWLSFIEANRSCSGRPKSRPALCLAAPPSFGHRECMNMIETISHKRPVSWPAPQIKALPAAAPGITCRMMLRKVTLLKFYMPHTDQQTLLTLKVGKAAISSEMKISLSWR